MTPSEVRRKLYENRRQGQPFLEEITKLEPNNPPVFEWPDKPRPPDTIMELLYGVTEERKQEFREEMGDPDINLIAEIPMKDGTIMQVSKRVEA